MSECDIHPQDTRVLHSRHTHRMTHSPAPYCQSHYSFPFHGCQLTCDCVELHSCGLTLSPTWHNIRPDQSYCGPSVHQGRAGHPLHSDRDMTKVPNTGPAHHNNRLQPLALVCFWGKWSLASPPVPVGSSSVSLSSGGHGAILAQMAWLATTPADPGTRACVSSFSGSGL